VATGLALFIPASRAADTVTGEPAAPPVTRVDWVVTEEVEEYLRELEYTLTMLARHTVGGPYAPGARTERSDWLDRSAYLLLSRIEDRGAMSAAELADAPALDDSTVNRQAAALLRTDLLARAGDAERRMRLTPRGRERLYRHRTQQIDELRTVLDSWSLVDIEVLASSIGRLVASFDEVRARRSEAFRD
jgi:DNA-binding MarR family transcriptional regulator